jgi:hypothetical protein
MTKDGAKAALAVLAGAGFKPAQGATWQETETVWCSLLDDCSDGDIARASKEYVRSDNRFFPKPGQLRALIVAWRAAEDPSHYYTEPDVPRTSQSLDLRAIWRSHGVDLPPKKEKP